MTTGAAILLTSHDLTDVERLADRICVLDGGRIVADGTPAELSAGATPRLRFRLDRPLATASWPRSGRAGGRSGRARPSRADGDGGRYRVDGVPPDAARRRGARHVVRGAGRLIVDLATSGGSLEDVYLGLGRPRGRGAEGTDR